MKLANYEFVVQVAIIEGAARIYSAVHAAHTAKGMISAVGRESARAAVADFLDIFGVEK